MKLPIWLSNIINKEEKEITVTKKSTVIATNEVKATVPEIENPSDFKLEGVAEALSDESVMTDDELFDTLQTILENQFMARDQADTILKRTEDISTMNSTMIKLLSANNGVLSGASSEEIVDYQTVIVTQRAIIRTILTIPVLDSVMREAISKVLIEMPEWEVLEAAEKRLKEREENRKTLKNLQQDQE